jgi:hypothetical protein
VADGSYEAKLTDVEVTLSDNTVIRESEISVQITRGGTDGILSPAGRISVSADNGQLYVLSPRAEQIEVYSVTGSLIFRAPKAAGEAVYPISHLPKGVLIVRGSSGWVKKTVYSINN